MVQGDEHRHLELGQLGGQPPGFSSSHHDGAESQLIGQPDHPSDRLRIIRLEEGGESRPGGTTQDLRVRVPFGDRQVVRALPESDLHLAQALGVGEDLAHVGRHAQQGRRIGRGGGGEGHVEPHLGNGHQFPGHSGPGSMEKSGPEPTDEALGREDARRHHTLPPTVGEALAVGREMVHDPPTGIEPLSFPGRIPVRGLRGLRRSRKVDLGVSPCIHQSRIDPEVVPLQDPGVRGNLSTGIHAFHELPTDDQGDVVGPRTVSLDHGDVFQGVRCRWRGARVLCRQRRSPRQREGRRQDHRQPSLETGAGDSFHLPTLRETSCPHSRRPTVSPHPLPGEGARGTGRGGGPVGTGRSTESRWRGFPVSSDFALVDAPGGDPENGGAAPPATGTP